MRIPFDFSIFEWMEVHDFEMELVVLTSSELWKAKFMELRKHLDLLSAFGSTYLCEQIFSHMKHILSSQRSRLTTEHSESCVKLKVTNYIPDIEILSKTVQGQGSH